MGLVDYYSDSDDGRGAGSSQPPSAALGKRKRVEDQTDPLSEESEPLPTLPPLPSRFHDLYASASRVSTIDDPSLHGGRTRIMPHVEGNWSTHVYLESSDLGTPLPLHISLSRPVVLTTEQRQNFAGSLQEVIENSGVRPFQIHFTTLCWVPNYKNTRWFLVLRIDKPAKNELNRLLWASNRVVMSFGQAPLYVPEDTPTPRIQHGNAKGRPRGPRGRRGSNKGANIEDEAQLDCSSHIHVSLGWSLEEPSLEMENRTKSTAILAIVKTLTTELVVQFETVKVKVGNAINVVPLPTKVKGGTGLIGL
ncbi:hypothetical protein FGG08_004327 [Glutinoglossum americanum]|uniref:U6 snRNA phosphodiesterase n=1 Tax=Glutinoglossum americanum TaxID=1670608 RepID=A0A9P8I2I8_9PEZI|nr:hypothetical protein FGG08_004327 [Glutinoglossum americanum]